MRPKIDPNEETRKSDKDRMVELMINHPGVHFDSEKEMIDYTMRINQLMALVEAKQRLPINESLLLANGFEKLEGPGDDDYYLYQIMSPSILGDQHVITHISFRHFEGDKYYTLFVEQLSTIATSHDEHPSPLPLYNRIDVYVDTIQQAEDAINAVGFPFKFSLKGYTN